MFTLVDSPDDGCRFAVCEPEPGLHLFCGSPQTAGKPYCGAHCRIAFLSPKADPVEQMARWAAKADARGSRGAFKVDIVAALGVAV